MRLNFRILYCLMFLIPGVSHSFPDSFEIWMLSPQSAKITEMLKTRSISFSKLIAQNDVKPEGRPMGDGYYFHPQIGLYRKDGKEVDTTLKDLKPEKTMGSKFVSATETDMIKCDKNNAFDLFCGKAKNEIQRKSNLEIWVDISSSFHSIDYADKSNYCFRRRFIESIIDDCSSKKVTVNLFDTSKKAMGGMDSLCLNYGLNDQDRLMKWIESSNSKKLIIITDISEYTSKLSAFVEKNNGTIVGGEKPMIAKDLLNSVSAVSKFCK